MSETCFFIISVKTKILGRILWQGGDGGLSELAFSIFLEEPEDNLFPPTQCQLINWMIDQIQYHDDFIFIATHSPYILNQMIKLSPDGMSILFTHHMNEKNAFTVRQLNDYEIHEIYDNGVDMFFNFEMYI